MKIYSFILILMFSFSSLAFADYTGGYVVENEGVSVDWGVGKIISIVDIPIKQDSIDPLRLRALALRKGGVESRNNLLLAIREIRLTDDKLYYNTIKKDLKAQDQLRGIVQNSLISSEDLAVGDLRVKSSLKFNGNLGEVLYAPTIPFLSGITPTLSGKRVNEQDNDLSSETSPVDHFSGVIIDARGLHITPALLPVIFDGHGVGVYGAFNVSREVVLKNGLVGYFVDFSSDQLSKRVGTYPLVIKAINTTGRNQSNIVLSVEDAIKIKAILKEQQVLANAGVAIIVDDKDSDLELDNQVELDGKGTVSESSKVDALNETSLGESSLSDESLPPVTQQ